MDIRPIEFRDHVDANGRRRTSVVSDGTWPDLTVVAGPLVRGHLAPIRKRGNDVHIVCDNGQAHYRVKRFDELRDEYVLELVSSGPADRLLSA